MDNQALPFAQSVMEAIDTPTSLGIWLCLEYQDHLSAVKHEVDPIDYLTAEAFFLDYQAVKLLSKYPYLRTGIDTRRVAVGKFIEAENQCFETNERFRQVSAGEFQPLPYVERVLQRARSKIAEILGEVPSLEVLDFSFGPGANYGVRGDTSAYNKLIAQPECTFTLANSLPVFLGEFPGWFDSTVSVALVRGSELTFVPKNAKTDRPICIEPLLNGLYQKGFGSYIRDRLSRFGVNLRDQTVNQKLASMCHVNGLATIDFASASDTIAYNLVLDLLPIDWFEVLDVARSPSYEYEGVWRTFQKFSSMGNAYTFELESLIFYALAWSSAIEFEEKPCVSVYGDDVIIPQGAVALFEATSLFCGFTINREKSFTGGPFFESCGMDYFLGSLVRPYLLKVKLDSPERLFYAHNITKRYHQRLLGCVVTDAGSRVLARLNRLARDIYYSVPPSRRCVGPEGYGDGWMVTNLETASRLAPIRRHRIYDAWLVPGRVFVATRRRVADSPNSYALYCAKASQGSWNGDLRSAIPEELDNSSGYSLRGLGKYRSKTFLLSEWPQLLLTS